VLRTQQRDQAGRDGEPVPTSTEDGDYNVKMQFCRLEEGDKVKIVVRFKVRDGAQ
jgi:translation initiation factor IF-3